MLSFSERMNTVSLIEVDGKKNSGEMKRKGDIERVPGSLAAGEDCRRARGVAGWGG